MHFFWLILCVLQWGLVTLTLVPAGLQRGLLGVQSGGPPEAGQGSPRRNRAIRGGSTGRRSVPEDG